MSAPDDTLKYRWAMSVLSTDPERPPTAKLFVMRPKRTAKESKVLDALLFVLRSGDLLSINAVERTLDQSVRAVKLAEQLGRSEVPQ
jgi:hypothetical protein